MARLLRLLALAGVAWALAPRASLRERVGGRLARAVRRPPRAPAEVTTARWNYYSSHPLARGAKLGRAAVRVTVAEVRARRAARRGRADAASKLRQRASKRCAENLIELGPTYVNELEKTEWATALQRLQDRVPCFPSDVAMAQLEAELGRPLGEVFASFESEPLAAASLGQVHRAMLFDNVTQVAVKIQRPMLEEIYARDVALLRRLAGLLDLFQVSAALEQKWVDLCDDCVAVLLREIDYAQEAAYASRFAAHFQGADWVTTPRVYHDLSTRRILTMECLEGISLRDVEGIAAQGLDRRLLAKRLAQCYFLSFCKHGFFNTDPHAGNLAADGAVPGGRLIVYDFGQACSLAAGERDGVLAAIESIIDLDTDAFVRACQTMGLLKPDADVTAVRTAVAANFASGRVRSRASKGLVDESRQREAKDASARILKEFTLPATYAFVARALSQMHGVGVALDPDFDFIASAAPMLPAVKGTEKYVQDELAKRSSSLVTYIQGEFGQLSRRLRGTWTLPVRRIGGAAAAKSPPPPPPPHPPSLRANSTSALTAALNSGGAPGRNRVAR